LIEWNLQLSLCLLFLFLLFLSELSIFFFFLSLLDLLQDLLVDVLVLEFYALTIIRHCILVLEFFANRDRLSRLNRKLRLRYVGITNLGEGFVVLH
jgi:hypothetical protein